VKTLEILTALPAQSPYLPCALIIKSKLSVFSHLFFIASCGGCGRLVCLVPVLRYEIAETRRVGTWSSAVHCTYVTGQLL